MKRVICMISVGMVLLLVVGALLVRYGRSDLDLGVHDGFDGPSLGEIWFTSGWFRKFLPGAVEIQSSERKAGNGSARITLRPGDQIPSEKGSDVERAELMESWSVWSDENEDYSYSFSIFIPRDFPIVPTRLVIAQWKQQCPLLRFGSCMPNNPVIALRYVAGKLIVSHQVGPRKEILYRTGEDVRGGWLDFVFHIRFSKHGDGRIKAWLNDHVIVDYTGKNAYPAEGGYPERNRYYFKIGLYRDVMDKPMTIYIDEFRKARLPGAGPRPEPESRAPGG